MKRLNVLLLLSMVLGLFSITANAQGFGQCLREPLIDVRGDASIDGVLGDGQDGQVTIAEVAVANPLGNLDTLVTAVLAADPAVVAALANPDASLTVFAPDNEAFAAIPVPLFNTLLVEPAVLTDVLLYHVVGGELDPRQPVIFPVESLLGQDLFFGRGFKGRIPTVNNSEIGCTGVSTDNGLVWIIDSVLQPQY